MSSIVVPAFCTYYPLCFKKSMIFKTCLKHNRNPHFLPCAWPGCALGHLGDSFSFDYKGELRVYKRDKFVASDGRDLYFWIADDETFLYLVPSLVRSEILRLAEPGTSMYHYTTLEGLKGIIDSEDFWLTDSAFMNDSSEIEHGIDIARRVFSAIPDSAIGISAFLKTLTELKVLASPKVNVSCFSSARDSLSQWRGYSKNALGVSIGFDVEKFFDNIIDGSHCVLSPIIYSNSKKQLLFENFLAFLVEGYRRDSSRKIYLAGEERTDVFDALEKFKYKGPIFSLFYQIVSCLKDEAFADERELRLFHAEHDIRIGDGRVGEIKKRFRIADNFIVPYTTLSDIYKAYSDGNERKRLNLPISEVLVGPHPRGQLAVAGITMYLNEMGFENIPVRVSAVPYR